MNLYGDLPKSKNKEFDSKESSEVTPWTEIVKPSSPVPPPQTPVEEPKIQAVAVVHKPERLAPPPSVLKKNRGVSTVHEISVGHHRETENVKYGYSLFGDIEDEYDPSKPNDYEEVIRERERRKQEAEMEAERQEQLRKELEEKQQLEKEKREITREEQEKANSPGHEVSPVDAGSSLPSETLQPSAGEGKGMNLAQKMLERFGWKEGEGLGKERQGMPTPLVAQKTDTRSAVIVKGQKINKPELMHPTAQITPIVGTPTRVVLLRNLVGPGEVDDALEEEVAQELQNYGQVCRVLIFEVTEDNFPPDEAIRIFVEFNTVEEAVKAASALHGRFFGGRIVHAGYYDELKFSSCDLAPEPGEF